MGRYGGQRAEDRRQGFWSGTWRGGTGQNVYMSCDLRYGTGERQETRDKRDRKRKGREKKYEKWCLGVYMEPKVW